MAPEPTPAPLPICIAGMHRSGTSMTARLLNLCGVYLGPREGLLPPQPDNPKGFWELQRFVDINEGLLGVLGAAWDRPPTAPAPRWSTDPDIAPLRLRALALAAEFRGREPWGFKDPRNSLTLAFWREVLGPLSVVICLRNPHDVVRSLEARGSTVAAAYRLWEAHYRALLDSVGDERSIVVHYESFFGDPTAELRRLTDFLGLNVPEANLSAACGSIDAGLRRNVSSTDDLMESCAPASVVELYSELCRRAGGLPPGNGQGALRTVSAADTLAIRLERMTSRWKALDERCARLEAQLEEQRAASSLVREQLLGWRALAERGEAVRGAWRKMTLLLKNRDPAAGIQQHGVQILDAELAQAVRLYAMAARDEGQPEVASDLERLGGLIDGALSEVAPARPGPDRCRSPEPEKA